MFCTKCGNQVQEGAAFCTRCGNKLNAPAQPVYQNEQYAQPAQPVYQDEQYAQPTQPVYQDEQYAQPAQAYNQSTYAYNQNASASQQPSYDYNQGYQQTGYDYSQSGQYDAYQYTDATPVAPAQKSKKWMIPVFVSIGATLMVGLIFLILILTCAFGHDYERDYSYSATCQYRYECSVCGTVKYKAGDSSVYAEHSFSGRSCSLCDKSAHSYLNDIVYNEGSYNTSYDAYCDYYSFSYDSESYYLYLIYDSYNGETTLILEDSNNITLELEVDNSYTSYYWKLNNSYYYMYGDVTPSSFSSYTYSLTYSYSNTSYSSTYAQHAATMLEALCYGFNRYCDYEGYEFDVSDLGFTRLYFY